MLKKEIIWRELLYRAIEKKQLAGTQQALAQKFGFSLSTIFHALKIPRAIGAIEVNNKGIAMRDQEKLIALWGSARNFKKNIIYSSSPNTSALEIEKNMPDGAVWGAYAAFRFMYPNDPLPSSYDKVYIYCDEKLLAEIKKRFPPNTKKQDPRLIVLEADEWMKSYGKTTTIAQTLADLWNLKEWYATEFYKTLLAKIMVS